MSAHKDKEDLGATVINNEPKVEQPKQKIVLGDFELGKKLGQGGMGAVYLARQISLDRPVALKLLSKELAKKPGFVERFIREARSMAKLDHVNAVKAYAADTASGQHYVAIEFIDGASMQKWMDKLGKLSVADAVHIILRCADALRVAHDLSMIHRDIKPDNILLTKKGIVKFADFGLAKVIDDEDMSMTQSGTGLGTPLYMAPEQARDAKSTDKRTEQNLAMIPRPVRRCDGRSRLHHLFVADRRCLVRSLQGASVFRMWLTLWPTSSIYRAVVHPKLRKIRRPQMLKSPDWA